MADERLTIHTNITGGKEAEKLADELNSAKVSAQGIRDAVGMLKTAFSEMTRLTSSMNKEFRMIRSAATTLQVATLAQNQQSQASLDRTIRKQQIEAQQLRVSTEELRLKKATATEHDKILTTLTKERSVLQQLQEQDKQLLATDRQREQSQQRVLTLTQRIQQVSDKYRVTRAANIAGGMDARDDRLQRIGLLIQRQQLVIDRARVEAAGQYTAELARQEQRMIRLRQLQMGVQSTQQSPREVRRVDPVSLFRVQADIFANYAVMGQALNMVRFASQTVVQFNKEMKDLQAVAELTNTEMRSLSDTVVDVSTKTRFSAVEVANAATVMAQAGFTGAQISESIEAIALLATATGTDLTKSVDVATSALTMFNMNIGETMRVANVMTGALNLSKLNMDKLQYGLQYAGNTAATMGVNLEELTAALGAMSNAGIKSGSTLGTGLNQLMVTLQNPTKKMRAEIERLGLSLADIDVESRGLIPVIESLRGAGFSSAQAFRAMELRAARAYLALSNNVDSAVDYYQALQVTNAAQKANDIQMESLANTAQKLANTLGQTFINAGRVLIPVLNNILNALTAIVSALNQIPGVTTTAIIALTALGSMAIASRIAALVSGIFTLGSMIEKTAKVAAVASSAKGLGGLFTAITMFIRANPIGLIITGVTILASALLTMGNSSAEASAKLDELSAKAAESGGEYSKVKDQIGTVDQAINRVTKRYTELNKNSEMLRIEAIALQSRFAELGIHMSVDLVNDANTLIGALQEVRSELSKMAFAKASQWLVDQRDAANQAVRMANESINAEFGQRVIGYGSRGAVTRDSVLREQAKRFLGIDLQTGTGNMEARRELERTTGGVSQMTQSQLRQNENLLLNDRSAATSDIAVVNRLLREADTGGKTLTAGQRKIAENLLEQLKIVQDSTTEAFNKTNAQSSALKAVQDSTLMMSGAASESLRQVDELVRQGNAAITASRGKGGATQSISDQMQSTLDKVDEFQKNLIDPNSSIFQKMMNETGQNAEQLTENLRSAFSIRLAKLGADTTDAMHDVATTLGDGVEKFIGRYSQAVEIEIKILEQRLKRSGDQASAKMSVIDATLAANSNPQSALYGRYSDAEVGMMERDKRNIQLEALRAEAAAYEDMAPKLAMLTEQQKRYYDQASANAEKMKGKGTRDEDRALKDLNETMDNYYTARNKEAEVKLKIISINNELEASEGKLLVAQKSMGEQIQFTISEYFRKMNAEENFFQQLGQNVTGMMNETRGSMKDMVRDIATGTKTIGEAFRDMSVRVIDAMLDIAAQQAATGLFNFFGGMLGNILGGASGTSTYTPGSITVTDLPPLATGGPVRRYAAGGGVNTRDSVPALLRPGEFVMRNSAVNAIGMDNLRRMNAAGHSRVSQSAKAISGAPPASSVGTPSVTNVYVVSPEFKPSLTKSDVLVTIGEDLYQGGQTAKLVKSIVNGTT